jgi:hypothetical protein
MQKNGDFSYYFMEKCYFSIFFSFYYMKNAKTAIFSYYFMEKCHFGIFFLLYEKCQNSDFPYCFIKKCCFGIFLFYYIKNAETVIFLLTLIIPFDPHNLF